MGVLNRLTLKRSSMTVRVQELPCVPAPQGAQHIVYRYTRQQGTQRIVYRCTRQQGTQYIVYRCTRQQDSVPVHTSAGYTAQSVPSSGAHVSMTKCCKPLGDLVTLSVESSKWTVLISTRSREVAQWIAALCHTKYKVSVPSSKECNIVRRRGSPGTTAARGGRT